MTEQAVRSFGPGAGPSRPARVILAGGGHAHLAVLEDWQRRNLPGTECILVTPYGHMSYSGMMPGWVEGIYRQSELEIDLVSLATAAGAHVVRDEIVGLDAGAGRLSLASGDVLEYDILSLGVGGDLDLSAFSGLKTLLPVRPIDRFFDGWRQIEQSLGATQPARIAIVGGGAAGTELALAIAARVRGAARPTRITLLTGQEGLLAGHASPVRARARLALTERAVEIHEVDIDVSQGDVVLPHEGSVRFDAVIAATGSRPPRWLGESGLALGPGGGVAIGSDMRSLSHPKVFAGGDVSERMDRQLARSGVHAVKAGPVLAANLRAAVLGGELRHYRPRTWTLYLLSIGERNAILTWGKFSAQGAWVWSFKDWIDRRFVAHFQRLAARGRGPPAWSSLARAMASPPVVRTAAQVSLVVGTCLNAINQGDELISGGAISWGRVGLNYLVPFLVASFSGARARQTMESAMPSRRAVRDEFNRSDACDQEIST